MNMLRRNLRSKSTPSQATLNELDLASNFLSNGFASQAIYKLSRERSRRSRTNQASAINWFKSAANIQRIPLEQLRNIDASISPT